MSSSVSRDILFDYCCLWTISCILWTQTGTNLEVSGYQFSPSSTETVASFVFFCPTRFYQVCWHPSVTNVAHKYSENSGSYKHPTAQEHCKPQLQSRILPRGRLSALYQRRARQARLVWMYRPHKLILCQNFTRKLPPDVEPKGKATTASSHGFEIAFAHGWSSTHFLFEFH